MGITFMLSKKRNITSGVIAMRRGRYVLSTGVDYKYAPRHIVKHTIEEVTERDRSLLYRIIYITYTLCSIKLHDATLYQHLGRSAVCVNCMKVFDKGVKRNESWTVSYVREFKNETVSERFMEWLDRNPYGIYPSVGTNRTLPPIPGLPPPPAPPTDSSPLLGLPPGSLEVPIVPPGPSILLPPLLERTISNERNI